MVMHGASITMVTFDVKSDVCFSDRLTALAILKICNTNSIG